MKVFAFCSFWSLVAFHCLVVGFVVCSFLTVHFMDLNSGRNVSTTAALCQQTQGRILTGKNTNKQGNLIAQIPQICFANAFKEELASGTLDKPQGYKNCAKVNVFCLFRRKLHRAPLCVTADLDFCSDRFGNPCPGICRHVDTMIIFLLLIN